MLKALRLESAKTIAVVSQCKQINQNIEAKAEASKRPILSTAKSKCPSSIWQRKGPGTKSISVIVIVAWYKINFIGSQLYRNESELIPIRGFVLSIPLGLSPPPSREKIWREKLFLGLVQNESKANR